VSMRKAAARKTTRKLPRMRHSRPADEPAVCAGPRETLPASGTVCRTIAVRDRLCRR